MIKKQFLAGWMAFILLGAGFGCAQTADQPLPSDQRVDETGEPETGPGPDVDVDAGRNAEGLVDVDVDRETDPDTIAEGDAPDRMAAGTAGVQGEPGATMDAGDRSAGAADDLPGTASRLPALALLGVLALAGAFAVRFLR